MFGKKHTRRSSNPLFVIFRLILSLTMFVVLLVGVYSAYKHFSGLDPLKVDPQSVISGLLAGQAPSEIVGLLGQLRSKTNIIPTTPINSEEDNIPTSEVAFRFLLIADSHNDNTNLQKAILQAKEIDPQLKFIIGLGDYTEVGTVGELRAAKKVLDSSNLRYFLVAGDHDLWDSRDKGLDPKNNYREVFGPSYQSFIFDNFKFLLLDNSDNYKGFSKEQSEWITSELEKTEENISGFFVFLHEPLFHPSSDHYMGKVEKDLKAQAESLIYQLKQAGVKRVFAGDIHYFSQYEEPVTQVSMNTVGALVTERNPQLPRYAIVTVYKDGSSQVDDTAIK